MSQDIGKMVEGFLEEQARRMGLKHWKKVEELAAAYIARNRVDPEDAVIVTSQVVDEHGNLTIRTHIERRTDGDK